MTTVLRPMSTGEVLDRTFSLYRNNFVLFFGISTVPPALWLLMALAMYGASRPSARPAGTILVAPGAVVASVVAIFLGVIAYLIGLALAQAATIYGVSAVHLDRTTTIRECYARLRGRVGRVLLVVITVLLIVFVGGMALMTIAIVIFSALAALGSLMGVVGTVVGVLLGIAAVAASAILMIGLFVRYSLAVPACVLEDIKVLQALKRSRFLAQGSRGRIVAIYFLFTVLNFVVSYALLLPVGVLMLTAKGATATALVVANHLVSFLVGALLGPIITIAMSLVYYDERVRKEAFDIQLMMATIDGTPPPAAATGAPAGTIG